MEIAFVNPVNQESAAAHTYVRVVIVTSALGWLTTDISSVY